MEKVQFITN